MAKAGKFSLAVAKQKASVFQDDVDVTIIEARFVDDFDYDGSQDACLALRVTFMVDGADEPFVQHYTAGDLAKLRPSDDGLSLELAPGSTAEGLGSNTNTGKFLASLVSSGFDDAELEKNDISCIEGLHVHIVAEAQKQSSRDVKEGRKARTLLVVNQIHEGPYEAEEETPKKGKGSAAAPVKKAKPPVEEDEEDEGEDEDEEEEEEEAPAKKPVKGKASARVDPIKVAADEAVLAVIEAAGGKIAASKLSTPLFKSLKGNPNLKKITQLATSDEYLEDDDAVFDYDGTVLTLKEE
jgi:hypothetical protein